MLEIQKFCKSHPDNYEEILDKEYKIKIKKEDGLVLFKYNQIKSNFNIPIVRECRGIILEEGTWEIVCHPLHKFGNHGEQYVPEIDWSSASVREKVDGSLIKLFHYKGEWRVSTNGMINAFKASHQLPFIAEDWGINIDTLGTLFLYTLEKAYGISDFGFLLGNTEHTHMFELCTLYNKVVVTHKKPKVFYLTSKHNKTGQEKEFLFPVDRPKKYDLHSLEDCISSAEKLPFNDEGYVVCDKYLNRAKVKSPAYVAVHHLKGEGVVSKKRVLDLVRTNEIDEFLTYFPEYTDIVLSIRDAYVSYLNDAESFLEYLDGFSDKKLANRKGIALIIKDSVYSDLGFKWLDNKISSVEEYYKDMPSEKILYSIDIM